MRFTHAIYAVGLAAGGRRQRQLGGKLGGRRRTGAAAAARPPFMCPSQHARQAYLGQKLAPVSPNACWGHPTIPAAKSQAAAAPRDEEQRAY